VHIHAPAADVYGRLRSGAGHQRWLPPAFADFEHTGDELGFALTLPLRTERTRLQVTVEEPPGLIELSPMDGGSIGGLAWALNVEGPREVHLTMELAYKPAGGPLGWVLEESVHRPLRRQALRDTLWRLKLVIEGRE